MSYKLSDRIEAQLVEGKSTKAKPNQSLKHVVHKVHKLGPGKALPYQKWLQEEHGMDVPYQDTGPQLPLKLGIDLRFPSGRRWRELVDENSHQLHALMAYKKDIAPQVREDACKRYIDNDARAGAKACEDSLHLQALSTNLSARDLKALQRARRRKAAAAGKAVGGGE